MGKSKSVRTDRYTTESSMSAYRLNAWGKGYFHILPSGNLAVRPRGESGGSIDVYEAVQRLREDGCRTPVLLRFPQLLEAQVRSLVEAFQAARKGGTRFVLARVSEAAMRVLELARLDRVFNIVDEVSDGLGHDG